MGAKQARTSAKPLVEFLERSNMTANEFGKIMRVSSGTVPNWLKANEMPPYVLLVIEALQRRQGRGAARNCGKIVICRSKGPLPQNVDAVLDALGLEKVGEFNTLDLHDLPRLRQAS